MGRKIVWLQDLKKFIGNLTDYVAIPFTHGVTTILCLLFLLGCSTAPVRVDSPFLQKENINMTQIDSKSKTEVKVDADDNEALYKAYKAQIQVTVTGDGNNLIIKASDGYKSTTTTYELKKKSNTVGVVFFVIVVVVIVGFVFREVIWVFLQSRK